MELQHHHLEVIKYALLSLLQKNFLCEPPSPKEPDRRKPTWSTLSLRTSHEEEAESSKYPAVLNCIKNEISLPKSLSAVKGASEYVNLDKYSSALGFLVSVEKPSYISHHHLAGQPVAHIEPIGIIPFAFNFSQSTSHSSKVLGAAVIPAEARVALL